MDDNLLLTTKDLFSKQLHTTIIKFTIFVTN